MQNVQIAFKRFTFQCRINHPKKLFEDDTASEITPETMGLLPGLSVCIAFKTDIKNTGKNFPGDIRNPIKKENLPD